jgi:hypothetical protein
MIIYLAISCITLSFCAFTYLWVSNKWERKKWEYKTVEEVALADELIEDDITARYRRRGGDYPTGGEEGYYPNRDYFIPLREFMKEDFLPKKRMKVHKLVERKQTLGGTHLGPGVYTREVDHSIIVRRNRDE